MVDSERLVREKVNGDIMRSREKSFDRRIESYSMLKAELKQKSKYVCCC